MEVNKPFGKLAFIGKGMESKSCDMHHYVPTFVHSTLPNEGRPAK